MVLAWGMMCALHRARATGQGRVIDAAITDGSAYISTLLWALRAGSGLSGSPGERWIDGGAPWNGIYHCADGRYVTVCALEPGFYKELLERLDLTDAPEFEDQWDRSVWPAGRQVLEQTFARKTQAEWCTLLEGSDACFGPVLDFDTAPLHPHNVARGTFFQHGNAFHPAPAPLINGARPQAGAIPHRGQHTDVILRELGLT
jgi:crotonobetainyl-CoA:carnitine CoA-transferase CaiB-like acyl-CoA transferase